MSFLFPDLQLLVFCISGLLASLHSDEDLTLMKNKIKIITKCLVNYYYHKNVCLESKHI